MRLKAGTYSLIIAARDANIALIGYDHDPAIFACRKYFKRMIC
jgi:hypothetical protein